MDFLWPYFAHAIFTLLLFPLTIEALAVAAPPVIDLGYALHQATISPVNSTTRSQNPQADFSRKIQPISNSPTSDMQRLPSEPYDSHPLTLH